jgi:uncharacterized peroxidase-related enzyme
MLRDAEADERERAILERARGWYGWVPNTIRVMARSASAADLYLDADERNRETALSALEREAVAVATAAHNRCEYCLTAHSLALAGLGASASEVAAAREAKSDTPRTDAILAFAAAILRARGSVSDEDFQAALAAGLEQSTLLDVVAVVIENSLGNYVNNLAGTPLDPIPRRAAAKHLESPLAEVAR